MYKLAIIFLLVFMPLRLGFGQVFAGPADFKKFLSELSDLAESSSSQKLFGELDKLRSNETLRTRSFSWIEESVEGSVTKDLLDWVMQDPERIVDYQINSRIIGKLARKYPRQMLDLVGSCPHRKILKGTAKPTDICVDGDPCSRCEGHIIRLNKEGPSEQRREKRLATIKNTCEKRIFAPTEGILAHEGKCNLSCKFCGVVVNEGFAIMASSGKDIFPYLEALQDTPLHSGAVHAAVRSLGPSDPARARKVADSITEVYPEYGRTVKRLLLSYSAYSNEEIEQMKLEPTVTVVGDSEEAFLKFCEDVSIARRLLEARFNRDGPLRVSKWIEDQEESLLKNDAYKHLAKLWLRSDFNSACKWIGKFEQGMIKDAILKRVLAECINAQLSNEEFYEVFLLSEACEDPESVSLQESLKFFFRNWASKDADAASAAIMKCSSLSGDLKERYSQVLVVTPDGEVKFDFKSR